MWNFFGKKVNLDVIAQNVVGIPQEEFAMLRKNGLGASDASVFLGLMTMFRTTEDLIAEKCRAYQTAEEKAIGDKESVRKGVDLEPLVLQKAEKEMKIEVLKPRQMFRLTEFPYLTVSFDGVALEDETLVPVEAKFVSVYGTKYYNRDTNEKDWANWDVDYSTEKKAAIIGIPAYYYAQVQQQMLALGSDHGYLAVQFDKDWLFKRYWVPRDQNMINKIIIEGYSTWNRITERKTAATRTSS